MSTTLVKVGPWGGQGGNPQDIDVLPDERLTSMTIRSGDVIEAYVDTAGNDYTTDLWGGGNGSFTKIELGDDEYVREISGTYGPYDNVLNLVTSLNIIVTNVASFSFGNAQGDTFSIPVENGGQIAGFYGRSGWLIDAIGVYIHP
ncbi:salt stress-induced protein [Zea mays]|nr:salt stress-induced protein [Zea mays]|eukprot:XP_008648490.1 salt stress-induced protein [Zea mays]